MAQFLPSAIYSPIPRFPPFLQDFSYRILQREQNDVTIRADEQLAHHNNIAVPKLSPDGEFTVTLRSANTFSQEDRELQKVDLPWPKFEVFESSLAHNGTAKLHVETSRGVPEYVFLRLDRVNSQQSVFNSQPVINTVKFLVFNQEIKTVSDLSKSQLYQATRRNSHIHALGKTNQKTVGAVLLHRTDVGNLSEFDEIKGNVSFDIEVTDFDLFHPEVLPDQLPLNFVQTDPLIFKVCFIYQNFALKGRDNEAEFWYT
jgi:hypothetical protein